MKSFKLDNKLIDRLCAMGINEPTHVQRAVIPAISKGRNIIALWKTGSGKTISYLAPIINTRLNKDEKNIASLILVPTRELAQQINNVCSSLCKDTKICSTAIYGGEAYNEQIAALALNPRILIATPGRLEDLMAQGYVNIDDLQYFVLDEVDQMLTLGFREAIQRIASLRKHNTQSLSFSATASSDSMELINELIPNALVIKEERRQLTVDNITQKGYWVEMSMMDRLLVHVVNEHKTQRMIVFTRSKKMADILTKKITDSGINAEAIHSDKSQKAREWILQRFASGENNVLVATDIIARGIDIADIDVVVNYGLPLEEEQYVHRIGRAARSCDANGTAVLLCPPEEKILLDKTCAFMKQHIDMSTNHPFVTIALTRTMMGDALRGKDTSGKNRKKRR